MPGTLRWRKQILTLLVLGEVRSHLGSLPQSHPPKSKVEPAVNMLETWERERQQSLFTAPERFILQNYRLDEKMFTGLTFSRNDKILLKVFSGILQNKEGRCLNPLCIFYL